MLRYALMFFVLALFAYLLGAYNIAGISMEVGKILLSIFLGIALLIGIFHLLEGQGPKRLR